MKPGHSLRFLFAATATVLPPPHFFDLNTAIQYALNHSPQVEQARHAHTAAEFDSKTAWAKLLPQLSANAVHGVEDTSPLSGSGPGKGQVSLGLSETLYDNGESWAQKQIADLELEKSNIQLAQTRDSICQAIAKEFYAFSLAQERLDIQTSQVGLIRRQYDLVSADFKQGFKTRKDFLRFKTQLSRAELDRTQAELDVRQSQQDLRRLIGWPRQEAIEPEFVRIPLGFPDRQLLQLPKESPNLSRHFETRLAELDRAIHTKTTEIIRRQAWPTIALSSAVTYQSGNYLGSSGQTFNSSDFLSWNALVTISFPIWDWGIKRYAAAASEERRLGQSLALESNLLQLRSEVEKLRLRLIQIQGNLKLSQELLGLEETNLQVLEKEYREGKLYYLDYVTGISNLADAKNRFYSSVAEFNQGWIDYHYHEGNLYDWITHH